MSSNSLSWISLLPYLETLIVDSWSGNSKRKQFLPSQIWELQYLRHLEFPYFDVVLPDPESCYQSSCILENLQTLIGIKNFNCTDEVLYRVPNLKALRVEYDKKYVLDHAKLSRCFNNLARLDTLETLHVNFPWKSYADLPCVFREPENLMFARNLRELTIDGDSRIRWDNMRIIGSLPRLEMLKLSGNAFCGNEWKVSEGEFECLKHLEIDWCDLSIWTVYSSALPRLQSLKLRYVELEEVPIAIGELASIESIQWQTKRLSTVIQLKKILEHAQEQGNEGDLLIKVTYWSYFSKGLLEEVMKKKLATDHFQINCHHWPFPNETEVEELLGTDQCKDFMDRWNKERDEDEMEEESDSESESESNFYDRRLEYEEEIQNKVGDAIKQRLAKEFQL